MALPDLFEDVGIVVGSMILLALPVSVLGTALAGLDLDPRIAVVVWFTPGLIVGALIVSGWVSIGYQQLWVFALASWFMTVLGWIAAGLSFPPTDTTTAVLLWGVGLVIGAYLAYIRPIRQLRDRSGSA